MAIFVCQKAVMTSYLTCCYKQLRLATTVVLLTGCIPTGHVVSPVSRYVLQERSLQPEVIDPHEGVWTISFDYRFEAQTPPDSTGTLWMNSELTLLNPGVKFVRIFIFSSTLTAGYWKEPLSCVSAHSRITPLLLIISTPRHQERRQLHSSAGPEAIFEVAAEELIVPEKLPVGNRPYRGNPFTIGGSGRGSACRCLIRYAVLCMGLWLAQQTVL